jgi:hypothetical protein
MSVNSKKSIAWMIGLVLLGIIALIGGVKSLIIVIPAAILIWYSAPPTLRSGRN